MNWFIAALKKYATFSGRAPRREYWFFFLFVVLISIMLALIDGVAGTVDPQTGAGLFSGIFGLATLLPGIAVTVRRLHDIGRSGWWILLGFIPIAGGLVLLIFALLKSEPATNAYGPPPPTDLVPL